MQFGFGWGKGRRVIKTTIAGAGLRAALARQQTWVDTETQRLAAVRTATMPVPSPPRDFRPRVAAPPAIDLLQRATGDRRPRTLRMAKAAIRRG